MSKQTGTFTFSPADYDGEVKTVGLLGTLLFYGSELTGHTSEIGMGDNQEYFTPPSIRGGHGIHRHALLRGNGAGCRWKL